MSNNFPSDLFYTKDHEWARIDGNIARIGITSHAVEQLGDVTMVELPSLGDDVACESVFGTVESVKAVSDLLAPLSGKITKVNESLDSTPESVNESPYSDGWLVEIEISNTEEKSKLMSAEAYTEFISAS